MQHPIFICIHAPGMLFTRRRAFRDKRHKKSRKHTVMFRVAASTQKCSPADIAVCGLRHKLCSVLQPPGFKSDILCGNSLTNRKQPSASSHIIRSHASSIITYFSVVCKHFAGSYMQNFADFIKHILCTSYKVHINTSFRRSHRPLIPQIPQGYIP